MISHGHNKDSIVTKDDSTALMRQTESTNFNLLLTGREPAANPLPDVSEVQDPQRLKDLGLGKLS